MKLKCTYVKIELKLNYKDISFLLRQNYLENATENASQLILKNSLDTPPPFFPYPTEVFNVINVFSAFSYKYNTFTRQKVQQIESSCCATMGSMGSMAFPQLWRWDTGLTPGLAQWVKGSHIATAVP